MAVDARCDVHTSGAGIFAIVVLGALALFPIPVPSSVQGGRGVPAKGLPDLLLAGPLKKLSSPFSHARATGTAFVSNSFNFVAGCLSDLLLVLIGETHSIRMPGMRTFEYPAYRRGPRRLGRALRMSRLTRSRPSSLSSSRALPLMSGLL